MTVPFATRKQVRVSQRKCDLPAREKAVLALALFPELVTSRMTISKSTRHMASAKKMPGI